MRSNYPRSNRAREEKWFRRSIGIIPASFVCGVNVLCYFIYFGDTINGLSTVRTTASFWLFILLLSFNVREIWLTRRWDWKRKFWFYILSCVWGCVLTTSFFTIEARETLRVVRQDFFTRFVPVYGAISFLIAMVFCGVYGAYLLKKRYLPSDEDYGIEPEESQTSLPPSRAEVSIKRTEPVHQEVGQ